MCPDRRNKQTCAQFQRFGSAVPKWGSSSKRDGRANRFGAKFAFPFPAQIVVWGPGWIFSTSSLGSTPGEETRKRNQRTKGKPMMAGGRSFFTGHLPGAFRHLSPPSKSYRCGWADFKGQWGVNIDGPSGQPIFLPRKRGSFPGKT